MMTSVYINDKEYPILGCDISVSDNTIRVTDMRGRTSRIPSGPAEWKVNLEMSEIEGIRLGTDLSGAAPFSSIIAKEFNIRFDNFIGVGMVSAMEVTQEGRWRMSIFATAQEVIKRAADQNVIRGAIAGSGDEALKREERFREFVLQKSRRAGQSRVAEAYRDRYNFYKLEKARELDRLASAEANRKRRNREEVEVTVVDEPATSTINNWGEEDSFWAQPGEEAPKPKEKKVTKPIQPKKRAIDL